MEDTDVVICGAGPSGLVLGLMLAEYKIKTIILEKQWQVEEDPRGIAMTGDATRIIYGMGLGEELAAVAQEHQALNFHLDTYRNKAYVKFRKDFDWNQSSLAQVLFFSQPMFEKSVRQKVTDSKYCQIRVGCEVMAREETKHHVIVEYTDHSINSNRQVRAQYLVGADGKKGVVRKKFLEPHGITQQACSFEYSGTWIAANLQITIPTPETHPDLPVWKLGISPQQLYDMYWPDGWHFCTHPTEPIAAGRFGPPEKRLWRHEFELEDWQTGMDAEKIFWRHLTPKITMTSPGLTSDMVYPLDCINVLRCRPFTFVQRVASPRWFHNRTMIIGDAAHVFPPFGGQGIASGVRDAAGLAWRLAALIKTSADSDSTLLSWNDERINGIEQAVEVTMVNGKLTNQKNWLLTYLQVAMCSILTAIPVLLQFFLSLVLRDDKGYKTVKNGVFLSNHGGGGKVSQIYMRSSKNGKTLRSDHLLKTPSIFTVIATVDGNDRVVEELEIAIQRASLDDFIVSKNSIRCISPNTSSSSDIETFSPCTSAELTNDGIPHLEGYDHHSYMKRLGHGTKYAIIRPDTIIFCAVETLDQFVDCLARLDQMMGQKQTSGVTEIQKS